MSPPRLLHLVVFLLPWLVASGCAATHPGDGPPPAEAPRDAARAHFDAGWSCIMDRGRWTDAEREFRAAVAADPDWVLARALVGRITTDVDEREALLDWIETRLDGVDPDERLLVDVYLLNLQAAIARDRGERLDAGFSQRRLALAAENFRAYVDRHPDDAYVSAEWIECVHARDGAEAALEAMATEVDPEAAQVPFFLSYRAALLSELGRHEEALAAAEAFETALDDPLAPAPHALYARIFMDMGRLEEASERIETAVSLDQADLSAVSLRRAIQARLGAR